tara:strand:+ start:86 stop:466 length:381 start_codon:yes stop_codon:yes gene_type:complete
MSNQSRTRVHAASNASTGANKKRVADERVEVIDVTVGSGARSGPYYPGDAKSIQTMATGALKFQLRGSGGAGGLANTEYRDIIMSAEAQTATTTKVGILTSEIIPYEFYLFDTSGSSNPVTMHIVY